MLNPDPCYLNSTFKKGQASLAHQSDFCLKLNLAKQKICIDYRIKVDLLCQNIGEKDKNFVKPLVKPSHQIFSCKSQSN